MKIKKAMFTLIGLASAILGIICYCLDNGQWEAGEFYGGDAYTGIQHAAAHTANNVQALSDIVKFGFGSVLLIGGLVLITLAISMKSPEASKPVFNFSAPTNNVVNPNPVQITNNSIPANHSANIVPDESKKEAESSSDSNPS